MYKGQHLYIKKASGSYTHHGLGIGDDKVIHYSGLANDLSTPGIIEELSLEEFAQNKKIHIKPHLDRKYQIDESIVRASLRLGEAQYHILHNNCEHFVEWCISGRHKSKQSQRGKLIYSAGIGARALIGVKNPIGFVAGAAAGYVYIHRQGMNKLPDFENLEKEFLRLNNTKNSVIALPYED
ncbi:lecithin retinol acyltransferase family protein [uncultured Cocleimonas sp.]|uniref:lecithin retinol acyltransferase family protein n=1 Tax=uncultured Cocleimonas sp. TaxID=1051587 RepID=UPI00260B6F7B|nr:lecithin retinol acyltransferase family protein [uncultured Cocleimonas sp.]